MRLGLLVAIGALDSSSLSSSLSSASSSSCSSSESSFSSFQTLSGVLARNCACTQTRRSEKRRHELCCVWVRGKASCAASEARRSRVPGMQEGVWSWRKKYIRASSGRGRVRSRVRGPATLGAQRPRERRRGNADGGMEKGTACRASSTSCSSDSSADCPRGRSGRRTRMQWTLSGSRSRNAWWWLWGRAPTYTHIHIHMCLLGRAPTVGLQAELHAQGR